MALDPGSANIVLDFGNRQPVGSVHGIKWNDSDGDGLRDSGDPGIAGVTIYLDLNNNGVFDQPGDISAVTMTDDPNSPEDMTGHYWLENVPAGEYYVREIVPEGFLQTFPQIREVSGNVLADDYHALFTSAAGALQMTGPTGHGTSGSETNYRVFQTDGEYLYVAAWSDDAVAQGLLAELLVDGVMLTSGDPQWQVYATGMDLDSDTPPTLTEMSDAIDFAGVSQTWTAPAVGPQNMPNNGPALPLNGEITDQAHWIWHDSGKRVISVLSPGGPGSPPFEPGFNHDEFLIFRIPLPAAAQRVTVVADESVQEVDFGNIERIPLPDGDDRIYGLGGNDALYGDNLILNPLYMSVGTLSDQIFGGDGIDRLFGQENEDLLHGEADHDFLYGGDGVDRVEQTVDQDQTLTDGMVTGEGDDSLSSIERATLTGGSEANKINASAFTRGPVVLDGGEGSDTLTGTLFGDRYVFSELPLASAVETDVLTDGGGTDLLDFSDLASPVTVNLTLGNPLAQHGTRTVTTGDPSQFENVLGGGRGRHDHRQRGRQRNLRGSRR